MDRTSSARAIIVGGGITGLAAALRLKALAPHASIVLLEAQARLGGKIQTERPDGYVLELGPDSFLRSKPAGLALAREVGIENRLEGVRQDTRRTFVMRRGALVPLPEGLSGLVPARLNPLFRSPLLSPWGKVRAALERIVPPRRAEGDESLGAFMRRRWGREAYERLIEPLLTGIYGGNGDELSLAATFPRLRDLELVNGSLLKGLGRSSPSVTGAAAPSTFLAPISGMAELVEAVEQMLRDVDIRIDTPALRVTRQADAYLVDVEGESLTADALILATPAYASAEILEQLDPELASQLRSICYASVATVSLAYREEGLPRPLNGHGYIIPRREGRPALACTWTSSKFANRAPHGSALIRGFLGRRGSADVTSRDDASLITLLQQELRQTMGIKAEPQLGRVQRWPAAMPQYTIGHLDRVSAIEQRANRLPGLFLAGAAYHGVGIPDCIESGEAAARRAAEVIAAPR